jgi:hypothetical protein
MNNTDTAFRPTKVQGEAGCQAGNLGRADKIAPHVATRHATIHGVRKPNAVPLKPCSCPERDLGLEFVAYQDITMLKTHHLSARAHRTETNGFAGHPKCYAQ